MPSIRLFLNAEVALRARGVGRATFSVPMVVSPHTVTGNRQDGPYTSLAGMEEDGFTDSDAAYDWAEMFFRQRNRANAIMVGRQDSADANLFVALDAIEAVGPSNWYITNMTSRASNDAMAMASWLATRRKIGFVQSDDATMLAGTANAAQTTTLTVGGTPTTGDYVTTVRDSWTGEVVSTVTTPINSAVQTTNTLIAVEIAADLDDHRSVHHRLRELAQRDLAFRDQHEARNPGACRVSRRCR